jgi:TatA/E family protein of Tat protein translocase
LGPFDTPLALFYDAKTASERPEMLSIPHLIIIFVVALVVFGPEKLPELARNLGKVMAEFRRATGDLRSTFDSHMRDLEREADARTIGGPSASVPGTVTLPGTAPDGTPGTVPTLPPTAGPAIEGQSSSAAEPVQEVLFQEPQSSTPATDSSAGNATTPETRGTNTEEVTERTSDGGSRPA